MRVWCTHQCVCAWLHASCTTSCYSRVVNRVLANSQGTWIEHCASRGANLAIPFTLQVVEKGAMLSAFCSKARHTNAVCPGALLVNTASWEPTKALCLGMLT